MGDPDWVRELKEAEDALNARADQMGRLKTEFDHNLNKLTESYYPKMRPLKVQVYFSLQQRRVLERSVEWLELVLSRMLGKDGLWDELRDTRADRDALLQTAQPAFDDAIDSLQDLRKEDLAVMRKYEHPPLLVLETMEAVMVLRGEESFSWEDAKFILCDTYFFSFFVSKAKNYDKNNIPDEVLSKLKKFMDSPDFEPAVVADASVPCGALCKWIRALYEHAILRRMSEPKRRSEEDIRDEIRRAKEELQAKKEETRGAETKLAALQKEFEQRRRDLKARYDECMDPLQDMFLEAHAQYGETFCSPRREHFTAGYEPPAAES
eukprot:TRINITY_DN7177_c1_g1_i1.p1 TRINITY_DN7177_c1_g1~~TRINITY_DN7177_c1_g1_i1.p1  ORF type:complete len:323 (+),score=88.63 TRINITY_DN7177_c1_g1_i1:104-1072(+)